MRVSSILGGIVAAVTALIAAATFSLRKPLDVTALYQHLTAEVHVGIDLGTTYSVAALCSRGNVTVVALDGRLLTPSIVSYFANGTELVGKEDAKAVTVSSAKRVIGRDYDDEELHKDVKQLPIEVIRVGANDTGIRLTSTRAVKPEEVGASLLRELKKASETYLHWSKKQLGFSFTAVTISVPVSFDSAQRDATVRAGRLAGFSTVMLLEEPIAAAMSYGLHEKATKNSHILVFDIGGGTLDVALLYLNHKSRDFYIEATAGHSHLGGVDFDAVIAKSIHSTLSTQHQVQQDVASYLNIAEEIKRHLTLNKVAQLCVSETAEVTLNSECTAIQYTRDQFHNDAKSLFAAALDPVDDVLRESGLTREAAVEVVLVGGSSRMPRIKDVLAEQLVNARIHAKAVDPDLAVATGAARSWGCSAD